MSGDRLWTPGNEKAKDIALHLARERTAKLKFANEQLTRLVAYLIDELGGGTAVVPEYILMEDRTRIPEQVFYDPGAGGALGGAVTIEVKDVDVGTMGAAGEGDGRSPEEADALGGADGVGAGGNSEDSAGGADKPA